LTEEVEDGSSGASADQPVTVEQPHAPSRWAAELRLAAAVSAAALAMTTGVAGWNSYDAWRRHHAEQQREMFLRVARQSAQDMTTISHTEVDADVQRILDMSVGTFHEEFAHRQQPFIEHIKHEQSMSEGTVTEAGLESVGDNSARALVAVAVKLSKAGEPEQKLRGFRMRIDLQREGTEAKVSNVEYVE
jgi:Mce-associated membrane protein